MGRQVLLFVEVFMTSVMSHGRSLLRATTPEALQEVQAAMTAGLTVYHRPMRIACARCSCQGHAATMPCMPMSSMQVLQRPACLLTLTAIFCACLHNQKGINDAPVSVTLLHDVQCMREQTLDAFLRLHGSDAGGGYFLGGRYSFAEVATSPFIARILVVGPHYRGYDAKAVAAEAGLTRLQAWMEVGFFIAVRCEVRRKGCRV